GAVEGARAALAVEEGGDDGQAHGVAERRQHAGQRHFVRGGIDGLLHHRIILYSMFDEYRTKKFGRLLRIPAMPHLLDPVKLGALDLPNRILMAPLTRTRAVEARTPNALMRDYYVQRASAGLILTEATSVTPMGVGYPDTPGIWSPAQVEGW